jgi:hypothetical protein
MEFTVITEAARDQPPGRVSLMDDGGVDLISVGIRMTADLRDNHQPAPFVNILGLYRSMTTLSGVEVPILADGMNPGNI